MVHKMKQEKTHHTLGCLVTVKILTDVGNFCTLTINLITPTHPYPKPTYDEPMMLFRKSVHFFQIQLHVYWKRGTYMKIIYAQSIEIQITLLMPKKDYLFASYGHNLLTQPSP